MNPYDFIPLGIPSPRRPPPGHDGRHRDSARSGVIHARLTTLGPFLIAKQSDRQNVIAPVSAGKIIPGSSLKGMIRSMAEIVGGGCLSLSGSLYHRGQYRYPGASEPTAFKPCSDINNLCITCRMFGALIGRDSWKGLVEPGEAHWQGNGVPQTRSFDVIVGQPKPEHAAFYAKAGKIRGRKAYYHHPTQIIASAPAQQRQYGSRQTISVSAIEAGQTYHFSVRHQGLDAEAYALLLYSLFLEPQLAHKIGWGKPMGFGSVRIEVDAIEEMDLQARYRGGSKSTVHYSGTDAVSRVQKLTDSFCQDNSEVMQALSNLFAYSGPQEGEDVTWAYPTYDWFQRNSQVSLEDFNEESTEGTRRT